MDLRVPGMLEDVDNLTTECLLTPYDRELLACVEQGVRTRLCMNDFATRHAGASNATPPHVRHRRRELPFP